MHISKDLIPDFAAAIGSTDERIAVEDRSHVREIDSVITQVAFTLFLVPSEPAYPREQRLNVFGHRCSRQTAGLPIGSSEVRRTDAAYIHLYA
jgi:hypothetical protein